jgi:hypothetical protein
MRVGNPYWLNLFLYISEFCQNTQLALRRLHDEKPCMGEASVILTREPPVHKTI